MLLQISGPMGMLQVSRRRRRWLLVSTARQGPSNANPEAPPGNHCTQPPGQKKGTPVPGQKKGTPVPDVNSMHGPCSRLNAPNRPKLFKLYNHASIYAQRLVSRFWPVVRFIVCPLFGAICSKGADCRAFGVFLKYARVLNI